MSRVHTGQLSQLAIKRLKKEAEQWKKCEDDITSQGTISASPQKDGDLSRWCANISLLSGAYSGSNFHVYLEIPPNYPAEAPAAYFKSMIHYINGAQYEAEGKGISICLDLLGNFANVHTEWATSGEASGWSPSYTISTILITLQGALPDMLRSDSTTVKETMWQAKSCCCSCGHRGDKRENFFPLLSYTEKKQDDKNVPVKNEDGKTDKIENPSHEQLLAILAGLSREDLEQFVLNNVSEEKIRALSQESKGKAVNPYEHIICYGTGCNPITDPEEIFGFGVRVELNGLIETPAEVLTLAAFDSGVKRSTMNENLDFFLPIFISLEHWQKKAFPIFKRSIDRIFAHTTKLPPNEYPYPPVQAILILCALMNSTCLAAEKAGADKRTANDRFINGYFTILRLLKGVANNFPGASEYADKRIASFIKSSTYRNKDPVTGCPNLGEFILLLHISKKYTWNDIALLCMEESDIRRVRWFLKDHPELVQTDRPFPDRYERNFAATETSRRLISFQVKFLLISKDVNLNDFIDGNVPEELLQMMKKLHNEITEIKTWQEYNSFLNAPTFTNEERNQQLLDAIKESAARGYHSLHRRGGGDHDRRYDHGGYRHDNYRNDYRGAPYQVRDRDRRF